jgi:Asp-tRNA(Asn)/Glu-tRNA(Gln) amidotransferase A subunit family amidase
LTDLHYLSASEAIEAFRARTLSPVELLSATLKRMDEVNGDVNAITHRFDDEAMAAAKESEARYFGKGDPPRPLEGIPLAVKDEEPMLGKPCTEGSLLHADRIADHDSAFVERMRASGAILHARTTTTEFCASWMSHTKLWGITRNPWNLDFGVGGSSSGSAAALAAGFATLASGSDIGGSIRIPASLNGVVGFKAPYGRIPQETPWNLDTYCHVGPLARTVGDCARFLNSVAGQHPADHVSLPNYLTLPYRFDSIEGRRIGVSSGFGDFAIDPEVRNNTRRTAEALAAAGAVVEEIEIEFDTEKLTRAVTIHFELLMFAGMDETSEEVSAQFTDYIAASAKLGRSNGGTPAEGLALETELHAIVSGLHERFDAIVCPMVCTRGFEAGNSYLDSPLVIDGVKTDNLVCHTAAMLFNVASRCPVMSVPSGLADNGVPTGVQIVGRPYDDLTVFEIAAALERNGPWLDLREGPTFRRDA